MSESAARRTATRVAGRDVLAIQDTSEIVLGGRRARAKGYGPVGKGGGLGGILVHPVLAVDAASGEVLGLADVAVWNRDTGKALPHAQRSLADKESCCWLTGLERAGAVLHRAAQVTVVSDRESDIYEDFARRSPAVHLLVRAGFNRRLANGAKLFGHADALAEQGRFGVTLPAAPGRPVRPATLAVRFGPVTLARPGRGQPVAGLKQLPHTVGLHLVDVREVTPPSGTAPVHWRLLTSHVVSDIGTARKMIGFYRKRWIIEEFFRTLKTAGFQIEDADIGDPKVMVKFAALALIAAVTVTQLLRARDNPSSQALCDTFDPDDKPVLLAICREFEGDAPTQRQTNPHPPDSLAYAAWIIARLGGWTGYYGKPGALVLSRGLQRYQHIKYGTQITKPNV